MGLIELFNLSTYLLTSIAIGYIGYWYAYHGEEYAKEDKYFRILLFGSPSLLCLNIFSSYIQPAILSKGGFILDLHNSFINTNLVISGVYSLIIVFVFILILLFITTSWAGIYWRKKGKDRLFNNLQIKGISNYKNNIDILNDLQGNTSIAFMTIYVYLKDGTILKCNDTRVYDKTPTGHLIIDKEKNIGLYVDEIKSPQETIKQYNENIDEQWGNMITYVPYSEIKYIRARIKNVD